MDSASAGGEVKALNDYQKTKNPFVQFVQMDFLYRIYGNAGLPCSFISSRHFLSCQKNSCLYDPHRHLLKA